MPNRNIRLWKEEGGRQRREGERKREFGFDHLHLNACARLYPSPSANSAISCGSNPLPLSLRLPFSALSLFLILFCGKILLLARSIRLFSLFSSPNSRAALDWRSRGF